MCALFVGAVTFGTGHYACVYFGVLVPCYVLLSTLLALPRLMRFCNLHLGCSLSDVWIKTWQS